MNNVYTVFICVAIVLSSTALLGACQNGSSTAAYATCSVSSDSVDTIASSSTDVYARPVYTPTLGVPITEHTNTYQLEIKEVYSNLNHPWGIAWYPLGNAEDMAILITERNGSIWFLHKNIIKEITGLPRDVCQTGQGGWFDIIVDNDNTIYVSYAKGTCSNNRTAIISFQLNKKDIHDSQSSIKAAQLTNVFEMNTPANSPFHFGGMMTIRPGSISNKEMLYIGLGERGDRDSAQDKNTHNGTVVAIDISIHNDGTRSYAHKIVSIGHRNPQGMFYDNKREKLYETEHGPFGGDEFNLIEVGRNYGWPVISWGKEYNSKKQVGTGTHAKGMEQPLCYWGPVSPALSGLTVYYGNVFSKWRGNAIAGALKYQQLYYITLNAQGNAVQQIEPLLTNKLGRIRAVEVSPLGYVYVITDEANGKIFSIHPASR